MRFTRDLGALAAGLAGLKAERGTALYDSLIFSFYNFNGLRGRRALLLLSDGKDEGSRFTWEETLEFARRAGVTVYVVGLGEEVEKKKLARLAEETGGRAFFPKDAAELPAIYAAIEEELAPDPHRLRVHHQPQRRRLPRGGPRSRSAPGWRRRRCVGITREGSALRCPAP